MRISERRKRERARIEILSPDELKTLKRFNWGAFLLSTIWTLTHKQYIYFIILATLNRMSMKADWAGALIIYLVQLPLSILDGFTANTLIWKQYPDKYSSVDELIKGEKKWLWWGIAANILMFILYLVLQYVSF